MLDFESKTGTAVNKTNFLQVYTPSHVRAFTKENIQMAFAKTGIYPYNPDIITPSQMKPSIESSTTSHGLPLVPPTPVRTMAKLITDAGLLPSLSASEANKDIPIDPQLTEDPSQIRTKLQSSSAGFIFSPSPIKSSSTLPLHVTALNMPFPVPREILTKVPETELEQQLQDSYFELAQREAAQHGALLGVQACMVLQSLYCERLRGQLFAKETNSKRKKGGGKLLGDGLPRCLTADDFFAKVQEFVEKQAQDEVARARRKEDRGHHTAALANWKRLEDERKKRESVKSKEYAEATEQWKAEKLLARAEKRKPRLQKPVRALQEPAIPKPLRPSEVADDLEEFDINIDDDSEDSGGD